MKTESRFTAASLTTMAALLVLAGCAGHASRPPAVDPRLKAAQELRSATDDLFAAAVDAGQAVVVIPTINLDSQTYDFHANKDINRFTTLSSGVTEWVNAASPATVLKVGNSQKITQVGPAGSYYQTVSGRRLYQIYVVAPGHYDLLGADYSVPHGRKPLKSGSAQNSYGIGSVTMRDAMFREEESSVEWADPRYESKTVTDTYCTSVRVVNGECVSWGQNQREVKNQVSAGGYETRRRNTQAAGLAVHVKFDKPFASFDIKPGEILLMDGFYPEAPSANYNEADCKRTDVDQVQCQMRAASLTRVFASMDNFRSATDPAKYGFKQMSARLQRMQYREPKILGSEVARESIWGQPYQIGK